MHLTNAMVSPAVAGTFGIVAAGALLWAARRARASGNEEALRPMAALGALVFALQMVDITIPGTGSSGHIGGGVLLAMVLGPHAGLLAMAAVLAVQALFFGDGGLMALGANIVNLGVLPCLVVAPLLRSAQTRASAGRIVVATVVACTLALQLGALGVVAQTALSGTAPPALLAASLLSIHLPVGLVEGLLSASVVLALRRARGSGEATTYSQVGSIAAAAIAIGGVLTWFSSPLPDGLTWSLVQSGAAAMPPLAAPWPHVDAATSISGVVGVLLTMTLAATIASSLRLRNAHKASR
ncbi:MAG TPA: energy-coupling factor ABC transporter permease [Burkholderiaceae bacterium]|nr:energy-coupling factor ABC transporter permease [Burkholderiaceae bacterium]